MNFSLLITCCVLLLSFSLVGQNKHHVGIKIGIVTAYATYEYKLNKLPIALGSGAQYIPYHGIKRLGIPMNVIYNPGKNTKFRLTLGLLPIVHLESYEKTSNKPFLGKTLTLGGGFKLGENYRVTLDFGINALPQNDERHGNTKVFPILNFGIAHGL